MMPGGYRPVRGAVSGGYGGFKTPHSNQVPVETLKSNFLFSVSHRMEIGGLNPPYPPLLGGMGCEVSAQCKKSHIQAVATERKRKKRIYAPCKKTTYAHLCAVFCGVAAGHCGYSSKKPAPMPTPNLERQPGMDDLEFYRLAHAALRDAASAAQDTTQRAHLAALREAAWARLEIAQQRARLVFAMYPDPGQDPTLRSEYVWIGNEGLEQPIAHPGLPGLDEAWTILLHGATAGSVLHASSFDSRANALHGRLKTAVKWVEGASGCFDLAECIAGIKVGRDGSITPPPITRTIRFLL